MTEKKTTKKTAAAKKTTAKKAKEIIEETPITPEEAINPEEKVADEEPVVEPEAPIEIVDSGYPINPIIQEGISFKEAADTVWPQLTNAPAPAPIKREQVVAQPLTYNIKPAVPAEFWHSRCCTQSARTSAGLTRQAVRLADRPNR